MLNIFLFYRRKYQFAEDQLVVKQSHLENKLSDLRASIAAIEELKRAEEGGGPSLFDFEIGDTLYTKATVLPTKTVHLWLGANVMLEYPLEEALLLLTSKSGETARAVGEISKQLTFVKEQITTMEVNMARLYNWSRSKNQ